MLVCDSGLCKDSNTYPGNEDEGQAHGAEEALAWETATTQEQPHLLLHSFGLSLHTLGKETAAAW